MMFSCRTYKIKDHFVVAICDDDLLGAEIGDEIKIRVEKTFYGEQIIDEETAINLMRKATIGNLIGERIVSLAIKETFIGKENIILIGGIVHAQFLK